MDRGGGAPVIATLALAALLLAGTPPAHAQAARVGAVELYGVRSLQPDDVRGALAVAPGDSVAGEVALRERLMRLPGVADAAVQAVCCEGGRSIVYAGIREEGVKAPAFGAAPEGLVSLPDDVIAAEAEFTAALQEAVLRGQATEDHSAGHALMAYPPARAAQTKFLALAEQHEERLREVLASSRFPLQRALAAQTLGYLPDKGRAAELLAPALSDPSPAVRNDAARALWVIAEYAADKPEVRARIPLDPLLEMMQSLVWSDRNKASFVLMALTSARDSAQLAEIGRRVRQPLEDMARWSTQHALPAVVILGRIRGLSDEAIFAAWTAGDKQRVLLP